MHSLKIDLHPDSGPVSRYYRPLSSYQRLLEYRCVIRHCQVSPARLTPTNITTITLSAAAAAAAAATSGRNHLTRVGEVHWHLHSKTRQYTGLCMRIYGEECRRAAAMRASVIIYLSVMGDILMVRGTAATSCINRLNVMHRVVPM